MDINFAPQQNWQKYNALIASHELERAVHLTPEEKFEHYAALFDLIHSTKPQRSCDHLLEIQRWSEKVKIRKQWIKAVKELEK